MKNMIRPFVTLVLICALVGIILGVTNAITEPIILRNAEVRARETRLAVLPEAKDFVSVDYENDEGVTGVHKGLDDNGEVIGYVVSVTKKGYKSVSVTVGLDVNGKVLALSVDASKETSGIGSKTALEGYVSKFIGLGESADRVDIIAQATYSSNAVKACVNEAFAVYKSIGGGME